MKNLESTMLQRLIRSTLVLLLMFGLCACVMLWTPISLLMVWTVGPLGEWLKGEQGSVAVYPEWTEKAIAFASWPHVLLEKVMS